MRNVDRRNILIGVGLFTLLLLFPLKLLLLDRTYDKEQYFVPESFNAERGESVDIFEGTPSQSFQSNDRNLSGIDIQFSGRKGEVRWELISSSGDLVRTGNIRHAGEGRISSIRFEPIRDSKDQIYTLNLSTDEEGIKIIYTTKYSCEQCTISIAGDQKPGYMNAVPVYKSTSVNHFVGILIDRISSNF